MTSGYITCWGVVAREVVNKGTNDEYETAVLKTADGRVLHLRLEGVKDRAAHFFNHLVGKRIRVTGPLEDKALVIRNIDDVIIFGPGAWTRPPRPSV